MILNSVYIGYRQPKPYEGEWATGSNPCERQFMCSLAVKAVHLFFPTGTKFDPQISVRFYRNRVRLTEYYQIVKLDSCRNELKICATKLKICDSNLIPVGKSEPLWLT